jgi:hypothetical protein
MNHRRIGSRIDPVCCAENVSVDNEKITPAQAMAGHHAHSHTSQRGAGVFARISDRSGARRGLRQGWGSVTRIQLLLFLLRDSLRFYSVRPYSIR